MSRTLALVAFDAVLGTIVGAGLFMIPAISRSDKTIAWTAATAWRTLASLPMLFLTLPVFLAVLTLAPVLIRYLRRRSATSRPAAYWGTCALAGLVFSVAAAAASGFYLVLFAFLSSPAREWLQHLSTLLVGPFVFGLGAILVLFERPPYVLLLAGAAFGLLNGALIRALRLDTQP